MSEEPADPSVLAGILSEQTDKRIDILRRIADVGSISEAARSAGVSYKAAWQAIDTLTNLAGTPLVEKAVGGAHGGGTKLTKTGRMVLDLADELSRARRSVLDRFANIQDSPEKNDGSRLARVTAASLQTSMRNQFPATIETLKIGSALVKLILRIDDTHLIRASVTKESAQLLGLRPAWKCWPSPRPPRSKFPPISRMKKTTTARMPTLSLAKSSAASAPIRAANARSVCLPGS